LVVIDFGEAAAAGLVCSAFNCMAYPAYFGIGVLFFDVRGYLLTLGHSYCVASKMRERLYFLAKNEEEFPYSHLWSFIRGGEFGCPFGVCGWVWSV
jgi:hypothetical protein